MLQILALFGEEDSDSRKEAIWMLSEMVFEGAVSVIEDNFRPVLKNLVICRENPDPFVRRQVLSVCSTMLSTPRLLEKMENFADLILVLIFRSQRDQEREVHLSICLYFVSNFLFSFYCTNFRWFCLPKLAPKL